jgi:hypothetical protein
MIVSSMETANPHSVDPSESISSNGSDEEATGTSTTSSPNPSVESTSSRIDSAFIQKEEQRVRKARCLLGLTTLACTIAVSVAVYYATRQNEYQQFQNEVRGTVVLNTILRFLK